MSTVLVAGVVIAVVVGVAAVILSVHGPVRGTGAAGGSLSPRQEFALLQSADRQVQTADPACRPSRLPVHAHRFVYGAPPISMTSVLGVLRRAAPPAQRVPTGLLQKLVSHGDGIYARYARQGTLDGVRYYLIPMRNLTGLRPQPARCDRERLAALGNLTQQLPATERLKVMRLASRALLWAFPAGVQLHYRYGNGGGSASELISRIHQYLGGGSYGGGSPPFTITPVVVPNGVASVTAEYPAESQIGHVPHRVITQRVTDNLVIFRITGGWDPPSLTYRSATGTILWSTPEH